VGFGAAALLLLLLVTMVRLVALRARSERRRVAAESGREALAAELAHHLVHDPLTRLPNRRLLESRLDEAVTRIADDGTLLAVLHIDIDRFRQVNDRHGLAAGDRVLTALAERLRSALAPTDTLARLGADQFGVLCEGVHDRATAMSMVAAVQEEARRAIEDECGLRLTVSVGVVLVDAAGIRVEDDDGGVVMADPATDAQSLIAAAEEAMYGAKHRGRGRHQAYTLEVARRRFQRTALVGDLREALAGNTATGGRLWVAYQPLVGLPDGSPVGVEALVRWTHPQLGEVSPAQFIPLAEESGLIAELGEQVTSAACAQAAMWNARRARQGLAPLYMSVNCSASQLLDAGAVDRIQATLRTHELSPRDLVLEVTESVLVDTVSGAAERLHAIAATGVRLALDDFGTGYSSLAYLRRFPFDVVKIDRSFAAGLGRHDDDEVIVSAIVAMATSLRCTVVIEGIETPEQARRATRLGCPQAQGYHFARPGPPESVEGHLLAAPASEQMTASR
jgi:diguanylate cyclase (GGDEF)-like protein